MLPNIEITTISSLLTDKIEPKRYEKRELLKAPPSETIITAIASEPESKIAKTASLYNANVLLRYSISQADKTAKTTADQRGLYCETSPTATPKRAE